jgi:peptidoglycan/xylan/chitin deacetylase (PgdA/CDA1 family)
MIVEAAAIFMPVSMVLGGLTYASCAPACNFWGKVVSRGPAGSRRVAITFDDGPTPGSTDAILDALRMPV